MTIQTFLNEFAPLVIDACKRHGWGVPSAIIGQAIKESWKGSGLSGLATSCHNYFGMTWTEKCGCDYKIYKTKEQKKDGSYYWREAAFRKYLTMPEGVEGYFKFIESYKRFKPVMAATSNVMYATQLKACGWATDLSYTQGVISIINKYNLSVYDGPVPEREEYLVGRTYTLQSNLYVRNDAEGGKILHQDVTQDAQKNALIDEEGFCILKKGTRVTCKGIKKLETSVWMNIPSGWICAKSNDKYYVK